uniref:XIAP associated factor 1 n=1 Tax=Nothobranchius kadleci TaxID=1051664 RepID=A0A1A8EFE0_NOTKA
MENEEATRSCGKCHRDIIEVNFALHEAHCSRFLCLCPDCDEAVPRDQLSQHREEQHTQVKCSKCNMKMERCHLLDHESEECAERLQACRFCEWELSLNEMHDHELVCGSRTALCWDCRHYVKLRDQQDHSSTCSATDEGSSPPQNTSRAPESVSGSGLAALFSTEGEEQNQLESSPAAGPDCGDPEEEDEDGVDFLRQTPQLSSAFRATSLTKTAGHGPGEGRDPDQISTCPYCHLALPLRTLSWHQVKCRTHVFLKNRDLETEVLRKL